MREYTLIALISVAVTVLLDIATRVHILRRPLFYLFLAVILGFKLLVNGYLTGKEVVLYSPAYYLGFRITSIPVEDFIFGFSMVTMALIFWESGKAYGKAHKI